MDSHVTPGLEISGTQPSTVPGDDYDGSGIGLAEVSTALTCSQSQHSSHGVVHNHLRRTLHRLRSCTSTRTRPTSLSRPSTYPSPQRP